VSRQTKIYNTIRKLDALKKDTKLKKIKKPSDYHQGNEIIEKKNSIYTYVYD
jgi:hypothetical protein